jgi:hypothetical protein
MGVLGFVTCLSYFPFSIMLYMGNGKWHMWRLSASEASTAIGRGGRCVRVIPKSTKDYYDMQSQLTPYPKDRAVSLGPVHFLDANCE